MYLADSAPSRYFDRPLPPGRDSSYDRRPSRRTPFEPAERPSSKSSDLDPDKENRALRAKIADLEAQLARDSRDSRRSSTSAGPSASYAHDLGADSDAPSDNDTQEVAGIAAIPPPAKSTKPIWTVVPRGPGRW